MMDDIFFRKDDRLDWSAPPIMQLELLPVIPISEQEKNRLETLMGITFEHWYTKTSYSISWCTEDTISHTLPAANWEASVLFIIHTFNNWWMAWTIFNKYVMYTKLCSWIFFQNQKSIYPKAMRWLIAFGFFFLWLNGTQGFINDR